MTRPTTLLVNPPLWNAYAPHLAVPLLAASLRERGWPTVSRDIGIEILNALISAEGLTDLESKLRSRDARHLPRPEAREVSRALTLLPSSVKSIDAAKQTLRSLDCLQDHEGFLRAHLVQRNALRCISAAFPGSSFDLISNDLYYSARSTQSVLEATDDPERNVYAWSLERLVPDLFTVPNVGLVAISVSADTHLIAAATIARLVKRVRPDVKVVVGGNYITRVAVRWSRPHPLLDLVDHFLLYEGEDALPALCEALFEGRSLETVPGLVTRRGDQLLRIHSHDVDIRTSPVPDYSDYPLREYFAPGPILPVFASRSCVWNCMFCSIPFASNKFRMRDSSAIVDELDQLHERHGARHFMFVDEIMTVKTMRGVAEELLARKRNYFWYGETRFANALNVHLGSLLRESGCRRLNFGLESYNQRVLDLMRKEVKLEWVNRNVDALIESQLPIHLFAILGFPTETPEEAQRTVDFAHQTIDRYRRAGVPWTTWGASPFILDLHSPVAQDPDAFGVEIVKPPREEDLALSARYHVRHGLSESSAHRLGDWVSGSGEGQNDPLWFHRDHRRDVEEYTFLRAAHEADYPGQLGRPCLAFPPDWLDRRVVLAADTTVSASRVSLVTGSGGPVLAFYRADTDYILELFSRTENLDADWPQGATVRDVMDWLRAHGRRASETSLKGTVGCLLRFGFLVANPALPALDLNKSWQATTFRAEQYVLELETSHEALTLSSTVTGKSLSLNRSAAHLWRLCRRPNGAAGGELADEAAASRLAVVAHLIRTMVELGFLAVYSFGVEATHLQASEDVSCVDA